MSTPPQHTLQSPVERLANVYQTLAEALKKAGLNAGQLNQVFARHVRAECVRCGMQVTGAELGLLHLGARGGDTEQKLERLAKGYCARRDCESYYYRVVLDPCPEVDWGTIVSAVQSGQSAGTPLPTPAAAPKWRWWTDKRVLRVAAGVALMLVLLVVRYLWSGGTIPLIHQDPGYKVDPSSLMPPAGR
jgi:hypothetical protein